MHIRPPGPRRGAWSTRPGRDLVTMCRPSSSTPHGRKPAWCVLVCSYGWPLPCLLDYCSAGPWVAAAAPPLSQHFSGTTPRGRKHVNCVILSFFVGLVVAAFLGRGARCVWFAIAFQWTLVQGRGGPPLSMLGGAMFRLHKEKTFIYIYIYIERERFG